MHVRHPPGRSGRVWLRARLDTASRATDLLEQKERVLVAEQRRLHALLRRTEASWNEAARDAQHWVARAAALDGRRAIALAARPPRASAQLEWRNSMGAYYPAEAVCRPAPERRACALTGSAALPEAVRAFEIALARAVDHAAAVRAADEVERELAGTRRRLRMLRDRWIPALAASRRELELALDEPERDDAVHARWARERDGGST